VIRFFDTSALVKRYVEELGSPMVRVALRNHAVVVARITLAEAAAAVARAARAGALTQGQRDVILARLPEDFAKLQVVEVRSALVARVPALVVRYPLRAYDAVQLAAALSVRQTGSAVEMWCADGDLAAAARGEGFHVVTPS
jgi:predicted nucleic acid-binding protein